MRRYPLVYALGGGNVNTPFARAMRHDKYLVLPVPFHFAAFRA